MKNYLLDEVNERKKKAEHKNALLQIDQFKQNNSAMKKVKKSQSTTKKSKMSIK